jgi:vitamin B12 transporter
MIIASARLAAGLAALPLLATAQDFSSSPPPPQGPAALAPVVVTATRTPRTLESSPAATLVIDRAQIEQSQAADVAQLLQEYAGLEVARTGGPGQPASLFVRGANSNHVIVLIDGVRLNDATSGLPPLADLSPELLERIEVIEGPRAALYGPDAIGGVVNLITRAPGPAGLSANVGGGAYATSWGGLAGRDQGEIAGLPWAVALAGQQYHSSGFPTFAGSQIDSAYRNRSLSGRGELALGGLALEARAYDAQGQTQYQNLAFDANFNFAGFTPAAEDFHRQVLAVEARAQPLAGWHSNLTASRSLDQLAQLQPDATGLPPGFVRTIRPELDWHNVLTLGAYQRLSFGARAARERVDALSFGSRIGYAQDRDYGYLQDELSFGAHQAVLAANYLHDAAFGERLDWNAEYGYALRTGTRLLISAGTAFHTPTANDRFGFGGNPNLKPEKARNYELALRQRIALAQHAELRLFRTQVRDLIQYLGAVNRVENVASAKSEGLQLSWDYSAGQWQARVDGLWQNPRNEQTSTQLLRRARLVGSAHVAREFGRYRLGASFYSTRRRADVAALDGAPTTDGGYGVLNLEAGVRLTGALSLDARLDNVLNKHYQTAAGYNQPGSAVYATLRYRLP